MNLLSTQFKTVRGLDSGPLRPHVQSYLTQLQELQYKPRTIRAHLCLIANLNGWLARTARALRDLNEEVIERFLRPRLSRRTWHAGERPALRRLLGILRSGGVIAEAKTTPPTPAERLCSDFRHYLAEERGCSDWTLENYGRHIDQFVAQQFGAGPVQVCRLQAPDVIAFVQRNAREHNRGHTLQVTTALRSFLRFLHYRGLIASDLSQAVPSVAHWQKAELPKHLPAEAVQKVVDACDQTTAVGRRNYAILLLLARLGLRAGEIIALRLDDIDWENGQITVRSKKGQGWARLPLPKDVGKGISRYLRLDRPQCSARNVFVRMVAPYDALSNSPVISVLTRNALKKAGVESARKGAHLFRHSLATQMLRRGASLDEIGQVLRHKDPDTTAIYAKVDIEALRRLAVAWPGGVQ
jgi:site-specific recombinase XerD